MCLQGKEKKIKNNIVGFILGSTICNIVNMSLWPLMIDWHSHRMWRLGLTFCEIMVNIKQITSTLSFCYVSFISFSIYTVIVCGWKIVNHKLFLAFELLSPLLPVFIEELSEHLLGMKNGHYDSVDHTCFTNLNDKTMKIRMLMKISVFLPLTMYFYIHILHTVFKSARRTHRNQDTNIRLTKTFSAIFLITLAVHTPEGVLPFITDQSECFGTVAEFLIDLPVFTSPIILCCMNKELRVQCLKRLCWKPFPQIKSRNELVHAIAVCHIPHNVSQEDCKTEVKL
ncbi:hypothetical protein AOXY_G12352 [Acipenser oxyrinchus oxyrinchus]|uniref:G-protein coupled receptors family 1 profile domain-containing protein n=1 Tax=Acipenser oxyrinchus oxyrinchus TaxID=40147 RepID=A0AAD8DF47_ACIOX|nr:hypothetical protein AOXY_G12352 [Acipenser oxyrinchus oxyrinchus]